MKIEIVYTGILLVLVGIFLALINKLGIVAIACLVLGLVLVIAGIIAREEKQVLEITKEPAFVMLDKKSTAKALRKPAKPKQVKKKAVKKPVKKKITKKKTVKKKATKKKTTTSKKVTKKKTSRTKSKKK